MILSTWVNVYKNIYPGGKTPVMLEKNMYETKEEAMRNACRKCIGQLELSANADFILRKLKEMEEK